MNNLSISQRRLCFDHPDQVSYIITGDKIYPHRKDLHDLYFYQCNICENYISTHKKTKEPMGYICNPKTRQLRIMAHELFDVLWKKKMIVSKCSKKHARNLAYSWLAKSLNIDINNCHIAMFDERLARETINICSKYCK